FIARPFRGGKAGERIFRAGPSNLAPGAIGAAIGRTAAELAALERTTLAQASHGGSRELHARPVERTQRLLFRWRRAHRQQCVGTGNEARGAESQEFPFRRQPARRPHRRHSGQPHLHLPPAPGRSATLPHPTADRPALLAPARSRRLAPRPLETPPRRSPRQTESAFHRLRQPPLSPARVAPVLNISLTEEP